MSDFDMSEILCDPQTGAPQILPKGTFVYRLNGRDRQKSASYYTPEVLTRSTVKYTLKSIIDEVRDNKRKATELLELKILEPAMGAAAFQNEVINQLAEAYLLHQQRQQRENGLRNWRISPDQYRDELQKVKAYIATHNVYGVDLNPTAVELGKLSLWLNVIHKDMETPFFANRICVGNAVIGAWLKVYGKNEVYGISERYGSKLKPNKWWEKAPHKIKFFANRVNRSVNEIYHFLLPDANMLGVRSIKEQKRANPDGDKRMAAILKDWTAPIDSYDFQTLQRLSAKIDILLKDYFTDQISIEKYTNNRREIWDGIDHSNQESLFREEEQAESYARKQSLFDTRYGHNNAYRKLKLAMDYWCSLWFWEYKDADSLPSRQEYWADIEALLDVDDEKLDKRTRKALDRTGLVSDDTEAEYNRISEDESQIVAKTQEEMLTAAHGNISLFSDDDPLRLKIVCRLAERYRFFHPMLEFLEVFWLRDGFDIICGNPPWVLPTFDVIGVFSDKFPEVVLKGLKAPAVRADRDSYFAKCSSLEKIYNDELIDSTCTNIFTNSTCCYPYLQGIKTDLYMCILESSFEMLANNGFIGMVHPESIYDTAKLNDYRNEAYHRLRYHFQYQNELRLFAEVHHETTYSVNVYGGIKEKIGFYSIHNLFHPSTVDSCFIHDGHGLCHGVKFEGKWNTEAHKDRVVFFNEPTLEVLANVFEVDESVTSPKLVNTQSESTIRVVEKLADFPTHVKDFNTIITVGFNETTAVDDGILSREVSQRSLSDDLILNGPHIYVATPCYKMPRLNVTNNSSYDIIDYTKIEDTFVPATCFISNVSKAQFREYIKGFQIGQDSLGNKTFDCWLDYYKLGISEWVGSTSERTLSGAIIPPGVHHIGTIVSTTFKDKNKMVELSALVNSVPLDFYMKITGASHVKQYRIELFPLGIADKYKPALFSRTLLLNCLTTAYADLWQEMWDVAYKNETWSKDDPRLKPFSMLHEDWAWDIPLRNYYERRQALVEIDVISAMALGLTLQDLEMIYTIQFPVLQQNENDTWYDAEGKIVFTCSKGLTGVGLDRKRNAKTGMPGWEDIRGEKIDENTYRGTMPTHTHTIDPAKSELYGGQQQTFVAPYTRCDRIADYRRAWAHFEKIFNK